MHKTRKSLDKQQNANRCPKCGAFEVEAMTPRTKYKCGSSNYDQRPNTFKQTIKCKLYVMFNWKSI